MRMRFFSSSDWDCLAAPNRIFRFSSKCKQQCLYFSPEPHPQGSLRPGRLMSLMITHHRSQAIYLCVARRVPQVRPSFGLTWGQCATALATQVIVQQTDANLGHQQVLAPNEPFWQKRYYDRNVRSVREFGIKLRYLHRNPVKRGLVCEPGDWEWSSFRHYAFREMGVVEIESEWTGRDREFKAAGGDPRVFLSPS